MSSLILLHSYTTTVENRVKIKVKARNLFKPWKTKHNAKFSSKKQKLYEKYLKNRDPQNLATYKTYKNLLETIKRKFDQEKIATEFN